MALSKITLYCYLSFFSSPGGPLFFSSPGRPLLSICMCQYFQTSSPQKPLGQLKSNLGERGGSVVECRTPEREVGGSKPTAAVLCP